VATPEVCNIHCIHAMHRNCLLHLMTGFPCKRDTRHLKCFPLWQFQDQIGGCCNPVYPTPLAFSLIAERNNEQDILLSGK
jgi:hypothetical protein